VGSEQGVPTMRTIVVQAFVTLDGVVQGGVGLEPIS
jgi:hypothetical protein